MKSITSRLNMFLAKIAGRDVDIATLTPPVTVNATEELLLEIADRVDAGMELPDPTKANDGDVLTVDNGKWGAAAPASGVPDATNAHIRDALSIVGHPAPGEALVPHQTITLQPVVDKDYGGASVEISAGFFDAFLANDGADFMAEVDGQYYITSVYHQGSVYYADVFDGDTYIGRFTSSDDRMGASWEGGTPGDTVTVGLYRIGEVPSVEWAPPVLVVKATYDEDTGNYVIDQPVEPFATAVEKGTPIMLWLFDGSESEYLYPYSSQFSGSGEWGCYAENINIDIENGTVHLKSINFGAEPEGDDPGWYCEIDENTFYGLSSTAPNP